MSDDRWRVVWFWRYWTFVWGTSFGATGWTPSTRTWQIGPLRIVRFYQPTKEDA